MRYLVRLRRTDRRLRRGEPAEHVEQEIEAQSAQAARRAATVPTYGLWVFESAAPVHEAGDAPATH